MLTSFAIVETLNFILLGGIVEGKLQQNAIRFFGKGLVNKGISEILVNLVTLNAKKAWFVGHASTKTRTHGKVTLSFVTPL